MKSLEDLQVLRVAEEIADAIWAQVSEWNEFPRDVVGKQLARAADSIGANIAESFGRFNYGEKIQFLYYARGSLFETKYWLNRAARRKLIFETEINNQIVQLTDVARQLNGFVKDLKSRRRNEPPTNIARENQAEYIAIVEDDFSPLFTDAEFDWLAKSPISNL